LPQPRQGLANVELFHPKRSDVIGHRPQLGQALGAGPTRGQNDDRRESPFENLGLEAHGSHPADYHPQVVFAQTPLMPQLAVLGRPGAQMNRVEVHGARAGHDRVGGGAQFEQMGAVAGAAKRRNGAVGGGNLAVRRHRHIHQHERQS
jgi:hypothetical protein